MFFTAIALQLSSAFTACIPAGAKPIQYEIRNDLQAVYDSLGVSGVFAMYDPQRRVISIVNDSLYRKPVTPASTFKIPNTLIGLETGAIKGINEVFRWDSVVRWRASWNQDMTLDRAFKTSCVWYYQEVARRVGAAAMQQWVNRLEYGNRNINGGIDKFWLSGDMKITPEQQLQFLERIHDNRLPVSRRSLKILKKIMIMQDTLGCTVRAKTGWGQDGGKEIGWYVGYVERQGKVYYFANCLQLPADSFSEKMLNARIVSLYTFLMRMQVLPANWL